MKQLTQSPHLSSLTTLYLRRNRISDSGLFSLANSSQLQNLRELDLGENHISSLQNLTDWEGLKNLTKLYLYANSIGDQGIISSGKKGYLQDLKYLHINENYLGSRFIYDFVAMCKNVKLLDLHIGDSSIENDGLVELAKNSLLKHVKRLNLDLNEITEIGLRDMVSSYKNECPINLHCLNLSSNAIGDEGLSFLLQSDYLNKTNHLILDRCELTDEGIAMLCQSPKLRNLSRLDLSSNNLSSRSARYLVESTHLKKLSEIHLFWIKLSLEAKRLLKNRFSSVLHLDP